MQPALPLDQAGIYVAAAYVVFVLLIVVYVAIMAGKVARLEKQIKSINELMDSWRRR